MLKTDKAALRRTLEAITADLRHAYVSLVQAQCVSEGQQRNVAGLITRQIRRLEDLMAVEDGTVRVPVLRWMVCPFGCGYRTGALGEDDIAARQAVAAHLQRFKHQLPRREAIAQAATAQIVTLNVSETGDRE